MNKELLYPLLFLLCFLALIAITQTLYRYFHTPAETSRKFLHVSGGILALLAPLFIESHWWILLLCASAFLLLAFTYLKHLLPSVHQIRRRSVGSIIFPIPVYFCFLAAQKLGNPLLFYIPVSYLTLSDTMAEWSGRKWGMHSIQFMNKQKSLAGSLSFALSSLLVAIAWGSGFNLPVPQIILLALTTATVATIVELVSTRGLDNFTVPMATLLCMMAMNIMLEAE